MWPLTGETQLPLLLCYIFSFFCSLFCFFYYYFPPTLLSSFLFFSPLSLVLFILHPFILSARHSLKKKTSCTDGLFFICISSLHLSVLCGSASLNPPCLPHTHPHTYSHYHRCFLLSCTLLFLYFTPSFFLCPFVPLASFLLPYPSSLSPPPPPHPLSAVPVGLWAGQVWAPAAFSKASAAAPATDPSNTATLTSVHTHLHSGCIITLLSIPVKSGLHVEPH